MGFRKWLFHTLQELSRPLIPEQERLDWFGKEFMNGFSEGVQDGALERLAYDLRVPLVPAYVLSGDRFIALEDVNPDTIGGSDHAKALSFPTAKWATALHNDFVQRLGLKLDHSTPAVPAGYPALWMGDPEKIPAGWEQLKGQDRVIVRQRTPLEELRYSDMQVYLSVVLPAREGVLMDGHGRIVARIYVDDEGRFEVSETGMQVLSAGGYSRAFLGSELHRLFLEIVPLAEEE